MIKIGVFTITIINLFWHVFQSSVSSVCCCKVVESLKEGSY